MRSKDAQKQLARPSGSNIIIGGLVAPHVSAHPYCARKSTCHVMHRARALSTKMKNNKQMATARALIGFNDLNILFLLFS